MKLEISFGLHKAGILLKESYSNVVFAEDLKDQPTNIQMYRIYHQFDFVMIFHLKTLV